MEEAVRSCHALSASVVVPSHRGAHRLPLLLAALAEQDVAEPWEVVVVLDGILDDSPRILDLWRDRLPLRVLSYPDPRGVIHALNTGFASAQGRVLIRCDDDLSPAPGMVRRHLAHHAGPDEVGVIGPTRDVFPDTPYAEAYGRAANARSLEDAYGRRAEDRWIGWAAHNSISCAAWEQSGGFDPRFVYGQDSELGYRLARQGVGIIVDPALELEHRGPAVDTATRAPRAFVSGASRLLFESVHGRVRPRAEGPHGARARAWRLAVTIVCTSIRSREGYARAGRLVDRSLPHLLPETGGRLVALLVEAAGLSGHRHGTTDLASYRGQKTTELTRETTA
jgi:glycosyltransferase involved in cell wall biosynthesis